MLLKPMETWYSIVRNLKDESQNPYLTERFCQKIILDLTRAKIKDKKKFRMRTGNDFDMWTLHLEEDYPKALVMEILNDDTFWNETLKHTIGV